MTQVFDVNDIGAFTGAGALFKFKALFKTAGYTVTASGDGVATFSTSSDIITQSGTGANGLNNTGAYFVVQSPAGTGNRQFLFQRGSSSLVWTQKYSFSAGFSGGSPSATVAPTATDSQTTWNAATAFGTDSTYRVHCMVDNAAPYAAYMICINAGGLVGSYTSAYSTAGAWMFDPLLSTFSPGSDVDQSIIYAPSAASGIFRASADTLTFGYLKKGLAGEGYVNIPWLIYEDNGGNICLPNAQGTLLCTGTDLNAPVCYARGSAATAPNGWKGVSSLLRMNATHRSIPDLSTLASTNDRLCVGDFTLPWSSAKVLR